MSEYAKILPIGALAKRANISVRALRHYEAMGLLAPSYDPHNGRRRYSHADITQVMKITTLKSAGLTLRQIADVLNGGMDIATVIQMQIRQLRALRDNTQTALGILENAAHKLQNGQMLDVDLLCHMMRSNPMKNHTLNDVAKDYFDDAQMEKVQSRGTTPEQLADYGQQWSDLIAKVADLAKAGVPADSDEALDCARQWNALISAFTRDDPKITASLSEMYADKDAWQDRAQMPYSAQTGEYIAEAQGALLERCEG